MKRHPTHSKDQGNTDAMDQHDKFSFHETHDAISNQAGLTRYNPKIECLTHQALKNIVTILDI